MALASDGAWTSCACARSFRRVMTWLRNRACWMPSCKRLVKKNGWKSALGEPFWPFGYPLVLWSFSFVLLVLIHSACSCLWDLWVVCRWMGLGQFRYLFPVAHILFSYWWATFRFCRLQVHHQPVEWIWLAGGTSLVILLEQRIPHLSVRISSFRCQNTTTHQTKTFSFFCAVADDPHQSRS